MSSKLDLLKRYGNASASSASNSKGQKKRRKKKQKEPAWGRGSDEEDFGHAVKDAWEDLDDAPIVVDEKGRPVAVQPKGSWNSLTSTTTAERRDASPPRQNNPSPSPPRRPRNDSPSPPRRQRKDSPSPPRRPARNDSPSPPRRARNDSPSPPRRQRKDSPSPPRRPARNDSPSPPRRRQRNDSPSPPRRPKEEGATRGGKADEDEDAEDADEDEEDERASKRPRKTASGYTAGLMSAEQFAEEDRQLRAGRAAEAQAAAAASGVASAADQAEQTVYRDRRGRKLDALNEFMRQQAITEGNAKKEKEAEIEWGKGTKQKEVERQFAQELKDIGDKPFARYEDDPEVDAAYKSVIHADDPMAQYFMEKQAKAKEKATARAVEHAVRTGTAPPKPEYKGPTPRPNRFGIKPGYRWDGRERGNGFEEKVLAMAANKQRKKDANYQWSVSDM